MRRNEYLAMGLYHIAKAVGFLNNDCQLVRTHGAQCMLQCKLRAYADCSVAGLRDWVRLCAAEWSVFAST